MKCKYCKNTLEKYTDGLCKECRSDPDIVITLNQAKLKYKLNHYTILNSDLFRIILVKHCKKHDYYRYKFLISDIEKLAYKLTKDLNDNDQRKMIMINIMT